MGTGFDTVCITNTKKMVSRLLFKKNCYNHRYERLLPANYADKISTFATAKSGGPLPNARAMTLTLNTETSVPDVALTLINMQFGQFVAHDCSLKAGSCTSRAY